MKILLISPLPPPAGGIASWTKAYLNSNIIKNHDVKLVNTAVQGERVKEFTKRNFADEIKRTYLILKNIKKNIKNISFDVIHLNTSCSKFGLIRDFIITNLVKKTKVKLVVHCHCDINYMVKSNISKFIFKRLCINSDKILVLNESSKQYIKAKLSRESLIIPNFIELKDLKQESNRLFNIQIKTILYVGHVVRTKGCDDILEVARNMKDKQFIMIGYVSKEIRLINKPRNVLFLGELNKNEVIQYMYKSDLLLFPTHTEGFPNVVLEAMACGLPIVTTEVGAIPDMIEDKGGIIVPIKDVKSIIKAINRLENIDLRNSISNWNIEKVKKSYTLDKVIKDLLYQYI